MSDQDLFPVVPATPPPPPQADQLLDLVKREDGTRKYQTLEDLAKGAAHGQAHIAQLTAELAALKEGKDKSALEAIMAKLDTPAVVPAVTPAAPTGVSLDEVERAVSVIEAKRVAAANAGAIKADLVKAAGSEDAAGKLFQERAAAAGLTTADLSALAAKSPAAARKLLGLEDSTRATVKTSGSISTSVVPNTDAPRPRVMMGGATSAQLVDEFRRHKPK